MKFQFKVSGKRFSLDDSATSGWSVEKRPGGWLVLERKRSDGTIERRRVAALEKSGKLSVQEVRAGTYLETFRVKVLGWGLAGQDRGEADFKAQFPGKVRKVLVRDGTQVAAGDKLLLLEAMKMEFAIQAPAKGTVRVVKVKEGQQLSPGDLLLEFEESKEAKSR